MRYKLLGRHTGLRISELVLGTGMFGTKWGHGAGAQEARLIFDGYVEAGGNFLDTSDSHQFGEAETLLGEFIGACRDDASAIPLGFPHDMLAIPAYRDRVAGGKLSLLDLPSHPVR